MGWLQMRLGCIPSPPDARDLRLASYLDPKTLRISMDMFPAATDWSEALRPDGRRVQPSTSALGNDVKGNCVFAGPAHREIVIGQITGREVDITTQDVDDEYSARTGYDPTTGANDNGWYIREFMKAARKGPMFNGKMAPIDAYVAVDWSNVEERAAASWLGVGTMDGFALPASAQGQKDGHGRDLWFIPPGGWNANNKPGTWGNHCMWRLGVSPFIDKTWTWGGPAWCRDDWSARCTFESWLMVSRAMLMRNGRIPAGFAYDDLMADVRARGAQ